MVKKIFLFLLLPLTSLGNTCFIHQGYVQSSTFLIKYYDELNRDFRGEIDSIFNAIDRTLSVYDSLSLVSRINNNKETVCSPLFEECFYLSEEVSKQTSGAFDVTLAPVINAYGFGCTGRSNAPDTVITDAQELVGFQRVRINNHLFYKEDERISLNFNAIAQGFSVDKIAEFFIAHNVANFMIEVGGEVRANGSKPRGERWRIGVESPIVQNSFSKSKPFVSLYLQNCSISTSGNIRNFYIKNGRKYVHTIDPFAGKPVVNTLLTATIIAPSCASADAYATACMVMGLEKSISFLQTLENVEACLLYEGAGSAYEIYATEGFWDIAVETVTAETEK